MIRLIIADDEEIIRDGLNTLISGLGLGISVIGKAENGLEALELMKEFHPEIVLMDINMPKLNGLDSIKEIRNLYPDTIIIIISGYDTFDFAQKAIEFGVFRYLLKPLDIEELADTLAEAKAELMGEKVVAKNEKNQTSHDIVFTVLDYIQNNFSDNELSLANLASTYHISSSHLARMIKEKTGSTFTEYITDTRMNHAKHYLSNYPELTIAAIAEKTGFSSQHYFSRAFKTYTGMSPNSYKKKYSFRNQ